MKKLSDPEESCFLCSKIGTYFDFESMKFIATLRNLCRFHTESLNKEINPPIKEIKDSPEVLQIAQREPGEEG